MSLSNWYSPSKCHLVVENVSREKVKAGDNVKFRVQSTCPCSFALHHEVVSRGNIQHTGVHYAGRYKRDVAFEKVSNSSTDSSMVKVCSVYFSIPVTLQMAPSSRLLVYYVHENNVGVADSITFYVKPSFHNQIKIETSKKKTTPGKSIKIKVKTKPDSCVCVAAVDKSLYLMNPRFLSMEQIFSEISTYDNTVQGSKEDHSVWKHRRKRSHRPWINNKVSADALYAFEDSGLLVMTDIVKLNHRQDLGFMSSPLYYRPYSIEFMPQALQANQDEDISRYRKRKRTFFPETWIWHCFNVSSTQKHQVLDTKVPDSITTWITQAFSISKSHGLALAEPVSIQVSKQFFVDITLPYSVKRGEQVQLPLNVYTNAGTCAEVFLKMKSTYGTTFLSTRSSKYATNFCIKGNSSLTKFIVLVFKDIGRVNITVKAEAFADSGCCQGDAKFSDHLRPLVGFDHVTRSVLSEPEGNTNFYTHSVFFCPNERIHITTPAKYEFQFLKKPKKVDFLAFAVRAKQNLHIALSKDPEYSVNMIEIILGGKNNKKSWIVQGKRGEKVAIGDTPGILSWDEYKMFWITWKNNIIQVGYGSTPQNNSEFLSWQTLETINVNYIGLSTNASSIGDVKLWQKESSGMYGEVFHLGLPINVVPGSSMANIKITGNIMGPNINNLETLIRLPHGCGEQNMIKFAPIVAVLNYLKNTKSQHRQKHSIKNEAIKLLTQGYQRQLTYRRDDGSYSAFGDRSQSGSMWLSAFILKSFSQARAYIYIDPNELKLTKVWILKNQLIDGSFPKIGKIVNKDLQGGVQGKVSLTAYVVTALLEYGVQIDAEKHALNKAKMFLEYKSRVVSDPYTASLLAYTLTLLHSDHSIYALRKLNHMKNVKDGLAFWKLKGRSLQEELVLDFGDDWKKAVSSAEIEMTAYALLVYIARKDITSALPVVKWLSQQRNAMGGFVSTQDTCVAFQALSEYASILSTDKNNLTVTLATTNMDFQQQIYVNNNNSNIVQHFKIPTIPTALFASAVGEGCALLQVDIKYNILDQSTEPSFKLAVKVTYQNKSPEQNRSTRPVTEYIKDQIISPGRLTLEACSRWMHAGSSNMAIVDVQLPTGFSADVSSLEELLRQEGGKLKKYESNNDKVLFYFDEIQNGCMTCLKFEAVQLIIVANGQVMAIRVYDYYEPAYEATVFYNSSMLSETQLQCTEESCHEYVIPEIGTCNSVYGCTNQEFELMERCSCYKNCDGFDEHICGSDGVSYKNFCEMEVAACHKDSHLQAMPRDFCDKDNASLPFELTEGSGVPGSGEDMSSGEIPILTSGFTNRNNGERNEPWRGENFLNSDLYTNLDDLMPAEEPEGYDYSYYYYDPRLTAGDSFEEGDDKSVPIRAELQTDLPDSRQHITVAYDDELPVNKATDPTVTKATKRKQDPIDFNYDYSDLVKNYEFEDVKELPFEQDILPIFERDDKAHGRQTPKNFENDIHSKSD